MFGAILKKVGVAIGKFLLVKGLELVHKRLGEKKAADVVGEAVSAVAAKLEAKIK